jgi:hypothetical protein
VSVGRPKKNCRNWMPWWRMRVGSNDEPQSSDTATAMYGKDRLLRCVDLDHLDGNAQLRVLTESNWDIPRGRRSSVIHYRDDQAEGETPKKDGHNDP